MVLSDYYTTGCASAVDACTGTLAASDPCCYRYASGTGAYQVNKIWTQCLFVPANTSIAIDLSDLEVDDCTVSISTLKDLTICNRTDAARTGVIVNVDLPIDVDIPPGTHFSFANPSVGFPGVTMITLTNPDLDYQAEICLTLAGVSI